MRRIIIPIILSALIFFAVPSLSAQQDSAIVPRLRIKISALTLVNFLFPNNSAMIGLETRAGETVSFNGWIGGFFDTPFYTANYNSGWFAGADVRGYIPRKKMLFAGLEYNHQDEFRAPMVHFVTPAGDYYKRIYANNTGNSVAFKIGIYLPFRRFKYPLELSIGAGVLFQNVRIKNATTAEYNVLLRGENNEFNWRKPGYTIVPYVPFQANLTFILVK
jgi:hypothetical protein